MFIAILLQFCCNLIAFLFHISGNQEGLHKEYICTSCGKSFARSDYLKTHFKRDHEGRRDHSCEFCGKSFFLPSQVKMHIKAVHQGQKGAWRGKSMKVEVMIP